MTIRWTDQLTRFEKCTNVHTKHCKHTRKQRRVDKKRARRAIQLVETLLMDERKFYL